MGWLIGAAVHLPVTRQNAQDSSQQCHLPTPPLQAETNLQQVLAYVTPSSLQRPARWEAPGKPSTRTAPPRALRTGPGGRETRTQDSSPVWPMREARTRGALGLVGHRLGSQGPSADSLAETPSGWSGG